MPDSCVYALQRCVTALHRAQVIAYPTEAVWGLGCDPWNQQAVQRLLQIKQRPQAKGLILVTGSWQPLEPLLSPLSAQHRQCLADTWPGATTWLIPHHGQLPKWITGGQDRVAIRLSAHPVVQALCQAWGGLLVSTSANRSGRRSARTALQVRRWFSGQIATLLPGALGQHTRPSRIIDLMTQQVLRA